MCVVCICPPSSEKSAKTTTVPIYFSYKEKFFKVKDMKEPFVSAKPTSCISEIVVPSENHDPIWYVYLIYQHFSVSFESNF